MGPIKWVIIDAPWYKTMSDLAATSRELIEKLVSFDTTSRESNLALIDFVRDYLAGHGVEAAIIHDESGTKANLYATIGPADRAGIMLSGHTDVVPVDGQDWATDPFALAEKNGRLYGRGSCDMKGFIAIALAHVPEFLRRGLATPIHLAFSYDEEVGCIGVRRLIDMINGLPVKPRMAIIGEPTEMQVIVAHKGKTDVTAHLRGFECHSSLAPTGVNAIHYAAELIAFCRDKMAHFKAPKTVVFGPLPKTSTGKIQKFALREAARGLG